MSVRPIFVTGIGTGIGKTIVSALLVEHLQADYWKPVQAGDLDDSDTLKVKALVSNAQTIFHPEAYRLTQPFSPHKSAALDGVEIGLNDIQLPQTNNRLVIEGAGGLMVPLNNQHLMIDLIEKLEADVVLVSRNYLGSINHTLLSLSVLAARNIMVKALFFNGDSDQYTEDIIIRHLTAETAIYRMPQLETINKAVILKQASLIYIEL